MIVDSSVVAALVRHLQAPPPQDDSGPKLYEHEVEKGSAFTLGLLTIKIAYLSRIAKERSYDSLTGQMESIDPKSPFLVSSNYKDPFTTTSAQKPRNWLSAKTPPYFPSLAVSRNSSLQAKRPLYGISSTGPVENVGSIINTKKYYNLPYISGLSLPHRNSLLSDRSAPWDSPTVYRPSTGRTMYESSLYPNALSKAYLSTSSAAGTPLVFDEFSSSKVCRDAFSLQFNSSSHTRSLWLKLVWWFSEEIGERIS